CLLDLHTGHAGSDLQVHPVTATLGEVKAGPADALASVVAGCVGDGAYLVALGLGEPVAVGAWWHGVLVWVQVAVDVDARGRAVVGLVASADLGARWPPGVDADGVPLACLGGAVTLEIGRASCRERVEVAGVGGRLRTE